MDQQAVRKTYKEKFRPTPAQEQLLEGVLWRCRDLYNTALEQRVTAWQRRHVSVSRFAQEAELKAIRAEMPEYAAVHSHVLQDVLARLDKTYQAFFRRVQRGGESGLSPRQGEEPLALLHLQGVRQRRHTGVGDVGPLQDRAHPCPLVAPAGGNAQDRHHLV